MQGHLGFFERGYFVAELGFSPFNTLSVNFYTETKTDFIPGFIFVHSPEGGSGLALAAKETVTVKLLEVGEGKTHTQKTQPGSILQTRNSGLTDLNPSGLVIKQKCIKLMSNFWKNCHYLEQLDFIVKIDN